MSRRHYLVTYDIADDKRRNRVFKHLEANGDHVQYSVFICELNRRELTALRSDLTADVHQTEDQILILDLGASHIPLETSLDALGRPYEPAVRTKIV